MTYSIVISPDAEDQLADLEAWWESNRPSAPKLSDELARVETILQENPRVAVVVSRRRGFDARRIRLGSSPYYLYFSIDEAKQEVLVLAVWSAMRRTGPDL